MELYNSWIRIRQRRGVNILMFFLKLLAKYTDKMEILDAERCILRLFAKWNEVCVYCHAKYDIGGLPPNQ